MLLSRAQGLLVGLAAGDRNRGPVQMALALAESLAREGRYDRESVLRAYLRWWRGGLGDDAWDTGPTTASVLKLVAAARGGSSLAGLAEAAGEEEEDKEEVKTTSQDGKRRKPDAHATRDKDKRAAGQEEGEHPRIEDAARRVDRAAGGMTAGVNATHRCAPLALASFLGPDALLQAARQESRLTHLSPISQACCAAMCFLCRRLVCGASWADALRALTTEAAAVYADAPGLHALLLRCGDPSPPADTGFCVNTLAAAVHFVHRYPSFTTALSAAIAHAGAANYCPVLVGALAGARYGLEGIDEDPSVLAHCRAGVVDRCKAVAVTLHQTWTKD